MTLVNRNVSIRCGAPTKTGGTCGLRKVSEIGCYYHDPIEFQKWTREREQARRTDKMVNQELLERHQAESELIAEYERWDHSHCPTCGRMHPAPELF